VPAACGARCAAGVLWEGLDRGVTLPLCAQGDQEARSQARSGPGPGGPPRPGGRALGGVRDSVVAGGHGLPGAAAGGHEGVHQEDVGGEHPGIRGPCHRAREGLAGRRDDGGRAPGGCAARGGLRCAWASGAGSRQRGPELGPATPADRVGRRVAAPWASDGGRGLGRRPGDGGGRRVALRRASGRFGGSLAFGGRFFSNRSETGFVRCYHDGIATTHACRRKPCLATEDY